MPNMPKRTKEQLLVEIKQLAEMIGWAVKFATGERSDLSYIGNAKRLSQALAVECQRLEDLENEGIEEALQQLRKGLEDE
jgi:hypothetical protein